MLSALLALLATTPPGCPEGTTLEQTEREVRCLDADGKAHGPYVRVYPDGATAARGEYDHGKMTGVWERFHPNGQVASRVTYVDDLPHGEYVSFREDGTPGTTVTYDHGARVAVSGKPVVDEDAKAPEGPPAPRDLSGTASILPVQANASISHFFSPTYRSYVRAGLHYARGKLTFDRNGTGRGSFIGFGAEAETSLYSWSECLAPCMSWAAGPSFRIGTATAFLASDSLEVPSVVLSDVFAYAQLTPRYVAIEGQVGPLQPKSNFHLGAKLELGVTAAGWSFHLLNEAHVITLIMRGVSLLLGLALGSPFVIGASLSNHLALWGELRVPEKRDRLVGAAGFSIGIGI